MPRERKRRHHQRSRNGCVTCKARHTRCDETKPYCRNCLQSGGKCGYSGVESSNLSSPSIILTKNQTQLQTQEWTPSPNLRPLSVVGIDPSETLGITHCPESAMLFDHYIKYRILTRTPTRRTGLGGELADLVRSDDALMHTAILLAANHWVLLGGSPSAVSAAFYHHKFETIRIINERLGDPARAGLVGTVGAVAAMALAEISCGSTEVATHHLNGLEHLLKLRGDLHTQSMSGLIHRMILLADTLTSEATNTIPRFSGIAIPNESARRSSTCTFRSISGLPYKSFNRTDNPEMFTSGPLSSFDREVAQMFHDLQYLSEQVAANDRAALAGDLVGLIENICTAEKNIAVLMHDRIEKVDIREHRVEFAAAVLKKGSTTPTGACARSGSIFVYMFLRRIPIHSPIFDWMVVLLQQDFERTEEIMRRLYPPELLLWILFIAGTASLGRPGRSGFRFKLIKCRSELNINSWNAAKLMLRKLAWLETPGDSLGGSSWEELEGDRTNLL